MIKRLNNVDELLKIKEELTGNFDNDITFYANVKLTDGIYLDFPVVCMKEDGKCNWTKDINKVVTIGHV